MMGLGKPQLQAKFEVAGFIRYGNIKEFLNINININYKFGMVKRHQGSLWST